MQVQQVAKFFYAMASGLSPACVSQIFSLTAPNSDNAGQVQ